MPSLYIGEQPVRTVALASNNDDATAVAADVMKDKIAYNQYGKIVGTAEPAEDLDSEMTAQDSLIEQIKSAVASKASVSYPTLSNPASAGNIESGYQAIDGSGNKITGTLEKVEIVKGTALTANNSPYVNNKLINLPIGKNNGIVYYKDTSSNAPSVKALIIENGITTISIGATAGNLQATQFPYDSSTGTMTSGNKAFSQMSSAGLQWGYIMW